MAMMLDDSPLIEKRFFVDFTWRLLGSADTPISDYVDQTLAAVPLDRTLVRRVSRMDNYSEGGGGGVYWSVSTGKVEFTSATNLRLSWTGQWHTAQLASALFRAEVIILAKKPKSLQTVAGGVQTINAVDTNKAMIFDADFFQAYGDMGSASRFVSSTQVNTLGRAQVVEF